MFDRPQHQRIYKLLGALNAEFLLESNCYFGGSGAIVLSLAEYREASDVDFLCATQDGYRALRSAVTPDSLGAIAGRHVQLAGPVHIGRYGFQADIAIDGIPVSFEVSREDRISLRGDLDLAFGVPILSREDLYAEKLLANADRYRDNEASARDIIDLAMLIDHWGNIPESAWRKARSAYGGVIDVAYCDAHRLVSDPDYLRPHLKLFNMEPALIRRIPAILSEPVPPVHAAEPSAARYEPSSHI